MFPPSIDHNSLPYRIAVLCYLYDGHGRVLLLHRSRDPNRGMYSPIGGKLEVERGESPHECAIREVREEAGIDLPGETVRLTGIVSETGYEGATHWLIFLFEVMRPIEPGEINAMNFEEGDLEWVPLEAVAGLAIPETDREIMWPLVQKHRGGFFMVHIDCTGDELVWSVEESIASMGGEGEGTEEHSAHGHPDRQ